MTDTPTSVSLDADDGTFESRLCDLLDRDWRSGNLVFSRGGKISRTHYTQLLGTTKSNATPYLRLFRSYEEREGSTDPKTSRRVVAVRSWLELAIADGTLEVRDGKVSRLQVRAAAGCSMITLSRDQGLVALISEYDLKIRQIGYKPRGVEQKLEELRDLLCRELFLAPNRMSINRVAVAKAVQLPVGHLNRKPYSEVLKHFDDLLLDDIRNDPSTVFAHGRLYEFAPLWQSGWSTKIVFRVAKAFGSVAEGFAAGTTKRVYLAGLDFMEFWGSHDRQDFQELKRLLIEGKELDAAIWEDLAWAWRDRPTTGSINSADAKQSSLNIFIDALAAEQLVPPLGKRLTRRRGRRAIKRRPTVAEALSKREAEDGDEFIQFASGLLAAAAARYSVDLDNADSSAFLTSLATEARKIGPSVMDDPAGTILRLLRTRLSLIQDAAQALVKKWRSHYDYGQSLLASPTNITAWAGLFDIGNRYDYSQEMRKLLPIEPGGWKKAVTNLLAIAQSEYGGLLPSMNAEHSAKMGAFFQKRYLEYGGFESLDAYLRPHNDAINAALTDYLLESGSNVAVGRTLFHDGIEESDLEGHARITGSKARARGKPIIVDLPEESPCVEALRWIESATGVLRARVEQEAHKQSLFLVRIGERCQEITEFAFNAWFKRLISEIPELADLNLTPAMIRASVLLLRALENDGRIRVGMAIGQHTEQVTVGYQQRGPVRMIYDTQIRIFQNIYETLVIHDSRQATAFVGRSEVQVALDTIKLRATGLGPFCRNTRGKPGHEGKPCPTADCWDGCPQMLFVAEADSVAAVQIWQKSLRACRGDWERDHPERWEAVWLPWLCFTDVVEEKMARGPLILAWNAGTALRQQLETKPGFAPPIPW